MRSHGKPRKLQGGGPRGLKPKNCAKNRQKPKNRNEFRPKPKTEIEVLTDKALVGFKISLSVI